MATVYTPITEIEAVNVLLQAIGEMPVNTIPAAGVTSASLAQSMLHFISRQVQGMGLHCNSDYKYSMTPDESGNINIPLNALRVEAYYPYDDYAIRARKLYDKAEQTLIFTDTVYVDIVFFFPFVDLPEHVRNYIVVKASRKFQAETIGAPTLFQYSEKDEFDAKAEMLRWEMNKIDDSILNSPFIANIVNRRA
jgi:hypothetical protein